MHDNTNALADRPTVSFCTYTFNDASLAHGMLRSVSDWTVQPDEIIVVDDGSDVPFTLQGKVENALPVRVMRLPENMGFTTAKSTGLNAAGGDVIFSADCDARMDAGYLETCIRHLRDQSVGLVCGSCEQGNGQGLLDRYLLYFGENSPASGINEVKFISGMAFALRRAVWEEVDGFTGHTRRFCSDHALSNRIAAKGYKLIVDGNVKATQERRLSRLANCRRTWAWCGTPLVDGTVAQYSLPEQFLALFTNPLLQRADIISQKGHPAMLYFDLLYISYVGLQMTEALGDRGRIPPDAGVKFQKMLAGKLGPYPQLFNQLRSDLLRLESWPARNGRLPDSADASRLARECDWSDAFYFADIFKDSGVLGWLNREGIRLVLEDEAGTDFSAYLKAELR
ncbi:MAG: glycosyltransferase [Deltaproteobacteria bacterium]|jgi:glycosyltransferase involved in cell wall biosynthesis|nr:glycosyltransferase [Deltaproteobacteria bacterium]